MYMDNATRPVPTLLWDFLYISYRCRHRTDLAIVRGEIDTFVNGRHSILVV